MKKWPVSDFMVFDEAGTFEGMRIIRSGGPGLPLIMPKLPKFRCPRRGWCLGPFGNGAIVRLDGTWGVDNINHIVSRADFARVVGEEWTDRKSTRLNSSH